MYVCKKTIVYHSKRYGKTATVPEGYESDGATGAIDIWSEGWWVHDWLCGNWTGNGPKPPVGEWDDGTKLTNWEASQVLQDILASEGRWLRSKYWFWFTYLFGGEKIKSANGWK